MRFMAYGGSGFFGDGDALAGCMPVWPHPHAAAARLRVVLRCAHMHHLCAPDFAALNWSCPHALPFDLLAGPFQD